MDTQTDFFGDRALKAALRRLFGQPAAPRRLRENITNIIEEEARRADFRGHLGHRWRASPTATQPPRKT